MDVDKVAGEPEWANIPTLPIWPMGHGQVLMGVADIAGINGMVLYACPDGYNISGAHTAVEALAYANEIGAPRVLITFESAQSVANMIDTLESVRAQFTPSKDTAS